MGCGACKRLLDNFHQSESPYTFNVKFSKSAQNSALNTGNSTKMLYIIQGVIVNNLPDELGQVVGHQNQAFSIITRLSVKTTLKSFKMFLAQPLAEPPPEIFNFLSQEPYTNQSDYLFKTLSEFTLKLSRLRKINFQYHTWTMWKVGPIDYCQDLISAEKRTNKFKKPPLT